ncbi:MAG: hypothetical protein ACRETD_14105, partial [Steroidobacteraceae bacterium]
MMNQSAADATQVGRRRWRELLPIATSAFCAGSVAVVLLLILGYVAAHGFRAISIPFLTQLPHPVGIAGGGVANGIVGSLIIVGLAALMAFPVGLL